MFDRKISTFVYLTLAAVIASGSLASNVSAQEIDARELLGRMGAEIASLEGFILSGEAYADAHGLLSARIRPVSSGKGTPPPASDPCQRTPRRGSSPRAE